MKTQDKARGFAPAPQQGAEPPAPSTTALLADFAELCRRHQGIFTPATIQGGIATIGLVQPDHAARLGKILFDRGVLMHSTSTTAPHVAKFLPVLTADLAIIDDLANALDSAARALA